MSDAPFTHFYNLGRLSQAGDTLAISPDEAERAALARWSGVEGIARWEGSVTLKKLSPTRFSYEGKLEADLTQACVVTLEPVPAHVSRAFTRELHFTGAPRRRAAVPEIDTVSVAVTEDEEPEEIESLNYDLGAPLIEEFTLALDPYPRAPGAAFAAPPDPPGTPENPFRVLGRLKSRP